MGGRAKEGRWKRSEGDGTVGQDDRVKTKGEKGEQGNRRNES